MEKSEAQKRAINLGKLLVKELQLESSVDTLGRWMAHYLAIKMTEAENAGGKEKNRLEKECFEIILKIWDHRWQMPGNSKPFQNFVPIFEFLAKLNPDRERSFYFDDAIIAKKKETVSEKLSKSEEWLSIAKTTDKYARIFIEYAINNAAAEVSGGGDIKWLENAPYLTEDIDVQIINVVLDKQKDIDLDSTEESEEDLMKKIEIEKLQSNIDFIQSFQKLHQKLLRNLKQRLLTLNQ